MTKAFDVIVVGARCAGSPTAMLMARRLVGVSMLTPRQLRAARVLVNWTRKDLAAKAGGSAVAIEHFERGLSSPKLVTASRWRRALEKAGVIFIDADDHAGPGVRLKTRPKD